MICPSRVAEVEYAGVDAEVDELPAGGAVAFLLLLFIPPSRAPLLFLNLPRFRGGSVDVSDNMKTA
jgi:hypothetical protein